MDEGRSTKRRRKEKSAGGVDKVRRGKKKAAHDAGEEHAWIASRGVANGDASERARARATDGSKWDRSEEDARGRAKQHERNGLCYHG